MYSSKSFVLLKLNLAPSAIGLIHTLHSELNTFLPSATSASNGPNAKEILEGFFQIINWDLKAQVSQEEFSVLITEWSKAKGSSLIASRIFELVQKNQFSIEQIIVALNSVIANQGDIPAFLGKSIETLSEEFDSFLYKTTNLGIDLKGNNVNITDPESVGLMNEIFRTFDQKEQGHLTLDELFFLHLSFLELEKKDIFKNLENEEVFSKDINNSFRTFLEQIKCFQGRVTARQMKTYLLYNGIATRNKLNNLRKSVRNITEIGEEMTSNNFKESLSLIPDRLLLSIRNVFPSINLSDMSRNPQDFQLLYHFLLVRFYPYIHEQEYFDGLFISNKVLLSQMLLKEFRKYYGEDTVRSVVWSFDLIQVFLSIFKAYNELSTHLLHLYYKFKTKDIILTTTNSARTGYFHEALSTGKETYVKELSNRPSRSILTGRSGDSQPSFRDSLQQGTDISQNDIKLEHLLPLRGNNVMKKSMGTTVKSKSPIRNNVNNNKENKNNKGSEGMRRVNLSQRVDKSGGSTQRDLNSENSMISESQRSNYKINNQRQRSVEVVPAANPQSLRKALKEVDENYMKKLLRNDLGQNLQGKKPSGIIENIEKFEAFSSRKSSAHENITMSIEAFPGHTPIQSKEMKYASLKVSKPPLKSNANSSVKSKPNTFSYKMNYESFNPRYHEIPSQMTESEDISPSSVKEREIKASEFLAKGKILTITDESLLLDEKSVNISEVNKLREQNNRSWQQEKSILENVVHGKSSRDYREEKDEADISMENNEPVHMRINDVRRASLASQKSSHFSEDAKAMKNKDILEIFNKLESKIYDVKPRPSSRFEDNYTSGSFVKSESKTSLQSKASIESIQVHKQDHERSILDIVKDQLLQEKKGPSSVYTTESREPVEDKKEFYLNLQELVSESKKEKSNTSVQKAPAPKVFSMSIAEHIQRSVSMKDNSKGLPNKPAITPMKAGRNKSKDGSSLKSVEKRSVLNEQSLNRSNITVKSRQSSSKSPIHNRSNRAIKTESFEVVMARLKGKKTPGNTPTKGNSGRKGFVIY